MIKGVCIKVKTMLAQRSQCTTVQFTRSLAMLCHFKFLKVYTCVLGLLEHYYEGERYSEGVKLVRSHQSSTDVHRCHNKVSGASQTCTISLAE